MRRTIGKVKDAFHKRHEELYTYSERHNAVEVVNIESTLYGHIDKPKPPKLAKGGIPVAKALKGHRKAIFDAQRQGDAARRSMTAASSAPARRSRAPPSSRR